MSESRGIKLRINTKPAHKRTDTIVVEPDHKTENNDHEPLKGSPSAKARSKLFQYPANLVYHDAHLYREVYVFNANVFGAVLINTLSTFTFFKMAETIESRSIRTS